MATITKTIGTTGRDYATITAWEAALGGDAGGAGNDAVGECYNDSVFDEKVTINDATPDSIKLTAPSGQRHTGVAGTGVRLVPTGSGTFILEVTTATTTTVEMIECDGSSFSASSTFHGIHLNASGTHTVSQCICHDLNGGTQNTYLIRRTNGTTPRDANILNNIIYDGDGTSSFGGVVHGISSNVFGAGTINILNNTVVDMKNDNGTGVCDAISHNDHASTTTKNNVACDTTGTTSGAKRDFSVNSPANSPMSYNASSDTTASGTGSITSVTTADQFVSVVGGSEDLHLKAGADCVDAGDDLGTTPTGVNIDIDGFDRDSLSVPWSIGSHNFTSSVGIGGAATGLRKNQIGIGIGV